MKSQQNLPLNGVKVVELATVVAAPVASRMLCAYGAEVIKVESLRGDDMRVIGNIKGIPSDEETNPLFTLPNSGKEFVSINIKSEDGKAVLLKLLESADVFISNVRLQSLKRVGLDYESLKEKFPKLIYAHFSGFGPKGPAANEPGFDSTAFWLRSGMQADWQIEGVDPFAPTFAFGDMATSSSLFGGIVTALFGRERTGKGTYLETSLYATGIWYNGVGVIQTQGEQKKLNPDPTKRYNPMSGTYKCKDGNFIGIYENEYTRDLPKYARILDVEWILNEPRFATQKTLREQNSFTELYHIFCDAFMKKNAQEWRDLMSAESVSIEVFHRTSEVAQDPQAIENGYVEEVQYEDGRKFMMPCPPIHFNNWDTKKYNPQSKLAKDTDSVLAEAGYSIEEIERMRNDGAIL